MTRFLRLVFALFSGLPASSAATSYAYVASGNSANPLPPGSFASLNPVTGKLGTFLFGPSMPGAVAASPDGSQIWVVNLAADGTGQVEAVSASSGEILATVALPQPPECAFIATLCATIVFRNDGTAAYVEFPVGNEGKSEELYLIDAQTYQISASLALTDFFGGMAVSPDGTQLCLDLNGIPVYNAETLALIGSIARNVSLILARRAC
jgi:DNA-binding beta-propeller fold protein YncE